MFSVILDRKIKKLDSPFLTFMLTCDEMQIIARFCPDLFSGTEVELVNLLKDNNDMIKEGVLNVLAKAGGTIREQLAVTSRCHFKFDNSFRSILFYNIFLLLLVSCNSVDLMLLSLYC